MRDKVKLSVGRNNLGEFSEGILGEERIFLVGSGYFHLDKEVALYPDITLTPYLFGTIFEEL